MHAAVALVMVHGPAPAASQHARSVRVVHHHDAVVFLGEFAQFRQRRDIAVHRENAVRDDQLLSRKIRVLLQDALAVLHILVLENFDGRFRKPRTIDDRSMIQLVGNDQVFLAKHRSDSSRVGRKTRLKHHAGFHVLKGSNLLLQLDVQSHRAGDRSNRPGAHAVSLHRV